MLLNKINGKKYIGSSVNLMHRKSSHMSNLRNCKHANKHLQGAWNKYGEDAFEFIVLLECPSSDLLMWEQAYLDTESPEYNIGKIAGASNTGMRLPDETKEKIRQAIKGRPSKLRGRKVREETRVKIVLGLMGHRVSEETRAKISAANMGNISSKGRSLSDESRRKIGKTSTGRKHTDEARAKISEAMRRRKGVPMSESHKMAISEASKGKKISDEQKKKLSDANKGKTLSEATRAKISAALTGRVVSAETREKISSAHKARIRRNISGSGGQNDAIK